MNTLASASRCRRSLNVPPVSSRKAAWSPNSWRFVRAWSAMRRRLSRRSSMVPSSANSTRSMPSNSIAGGCAGVASQAFRAAVPSGVIE